MNKTKSKVYFSSPQTPASIIIPAYNQASPLAKLLNCLLKWAPASWEIIVIDDNSTDQTSQVARRQRVIYYRQKQNQGPAKARNIGAKIAHGDILIYFDADVIPNKQSLKQAIAPFRKKTKLKAVSGIWSKKQKSQSFFPQFKALRDWSYYFKENQPNNQTGYFFNTRVGAIKKDFFLEVGGFNTSYKKADLEDVDLSFRINQISPVQFNPRFQVSHEFGNFYSIVKNHLRRSYYFWEIFFRYHRFGRVVATPNEALSLFLVVILIIFFILRLWLVLPLGLFLIAFSLYLFQNRKFLQFFYLEKGIGFTIKAFFFNWFLQLASCLTLAFFLVKKASKIVWDHLK